MLDRAEEILTTSETDEHRALRDALRFLLLLEEVVAIESTHPHGLEKRPFLDSAWTRL